ncbi:hypothetical protein Pst134EA_024251 [Puccinia striiformis f. sp. tritici]|uniref:Secreted protein n=2 Tax=Puccinia striiformis TaxID=27350 RepID=A0A0L0UUG0_9BASI|nr:hypothetical protein Pst134EA_024251 [Puccinia striiformis f. sp. tritici]KAI9606708.1 hypothetical protein H4Q26_006245 [Puccinia striiformis f. sp. tritici PST-130]KNE90660.1 hypothetical protein PSTG_15921 [Puccinia striiformis f. sp. tritici PST-78]POW22932.1 hypothetical protein PSHT_00646 [Puccinia striiformis]KAH9444683.1 hypothetical protein Pst134EB_024940 [Puccinia striiformis f. sp. tritici]KAH9453374.1 hypothetical protein Pst134EA_024251 [Puccinia striiformis f. sp. tritici]
MRSSICFVLCTLLLIQSVCSIFVCNDGSKPQEKQGICLRRIDTKLDPKNKDLPSLDKKEFLVIDATSVSPDHWTCSKLQIANAPVTRRYCCNMKPDAKPRAFTQKDIDTLCYTRDAKRDGKKKQNKP